MDPRYPARNLLLKRTPVLVGHPARALRSRRLRRGLAVRARHRNPHGCTRCTPLVLRARLVPALRSATARARARPPRRSAAGGADHVGGGFYLAAAAGARTL